jgi:hypothetical protein
MRKQCKSIYKNNIKACESSVKAYIKATFLIIKYFKIIKR